ncbi:MAG: ABC transporter permease [Myxococcales bacterium]
MLRIFLRAYPKEFRERHGEEILALCRDVYGPGFSLRAAGDLLWNGLSARLGAAPASFEDWLERPAREGRGDRFLAKLLYDVRHGMRGLATSGAFTLAILLTLALGIGANTAIFSVVDAVLLRPLPYESGDRLVHLLQPAKASGVENVSFSPMEVQDYRALTHTLDAVVEYHSMQFVLLGGAEPQRVQTGVVSANFFAAFGVRPLIGRAFLPADDEQGAPAVLVLSYEYWQRAYRGDRGIVGKTFTMNDKVHQVVGVLPRIPQYPEENDVYMPTVACPFRNGKHWPNDRAARGLAVFGRMRRGATIEQVRTDVGEIASRLHGQYPAAYPTAERFGTAAELLRDELTRRAKPTLLVLLSTALFLLVIVCANVANLTLARLVRREREMAIRTALGATRLRLFQQLLTENLILALCGGALGVLLASFGVDALAAFAARFTTRAGEVSLDGRVLLFAIVLSVGTGVLLGCLPALPARANLVADLKEGGGATTHRGRLRLRRALIVSQVAVSFALLIGAGLMLRSLVKLQRVQAGFDPENVLTARIDLNWSRYADNDKVRGFASKLLERLKDQPGVVAVALGGTVPLTGADAFTVPYQVEGARGEGGAQPQTELDIASPDYFRAMGIPLVAGRAFTAADQPPAPAVAIVNQSFARHVFAGQNPIGRRLSANGGKAWATIVGIAADVKQHGLEREPSDEVYSPIGFDVFRDLRLVVRSKGAPRFLEREVRAAVRELDSDQPVTEVRTLEQVRADALASPRLTALLLGAFAALALCITAAGIAGVMAYSVNQRTQEIGIRMALGARREEVLRMVLRQGMALVAAGLALGLFGGLAISRAMTGLVFGIAASDPVTWIAGAGVLAAVGAVACFLPARRAAGVDPVIALRSA